MKAAAFLRLRLVAKILEAAIAAAEHLLSRFTLPASPAPI
jgi:hypothetical protein